MTNARKTRIVKANKNQELLDLITMISVSLFILVLLAVLILIESQVTVGRQPVEVKIESKRKK